MRCRNQHILEPCPQPPQESRQSRPRLGTAAMKTDNGPDAPGQQVESPRKTTGWPDENSSLKQLAKTLQRKRGACPHSFVRFVVATASGQRRKLLSQCSPHPQTGATAQPPSRFPCRYSPTRHPPRQGTNVQACQMPSSLQQALEATRWTRVAAQLEAGAAARKGESTQTQASPPHASSAPRLGLRWAEDWRSPQPPCLCGREPASLSSQTEAGRSGTDRTTPS